MRPIHVHEIEVTDGLPPHQRWRAMLTVAIAIAMSVLVTSIANIALPTIARDMHATPADSIWVVNAYQLAVTVTLLPFASIGDIYGHRRVYVWGLLVYTAASFVCAVAPSLPVLVIGRVLQGFGGAGIMSVNGALVRFIYPRAELGRGIGFNALVVAGRPRPARRSRRRSCRYCPGPGCSHCRCLLASSRCGWRIASCRERRSPATHSIR